MYKPGKIVAVVLSDDGSKHKVIRFSYTKQFQSGFLGGRGYNSGLLYMIRKSLKVPVKDWKDSMNVVCISGGLFAGTDFPSSGRTTISVLVSPVTGMFSDGNLGGHFGPALRLAGIDQLVIIGKALSPTSIFITKSGKILFYDASRYKNYGIFASEAILAEQPLSIPGAPPAKTKMVALTVGAAGMNGTFCSTTMHEDRAAGGGGTGAVLGSKNIKCIGVQYDRKSPKQIAPTNMTGWRSVREKAIEHIENHPVYSTFSTYGTTSLIEIHSGLKYLPTNNWMKSDSPQWKKISGEALLKRDIEMCGNLDNYNKRVQQKKDDKTLFCRHCPICCSSLDKIEYETLNCLGPKIGIYDLQWILRTNSLIMNDYGLDVIQSTSILSALMEMSELEILHGGPGFGNKAYAEEFLRELALGIEYPGAVSLAPYFKDGFQHGLQSAYLDGEIEIDLDKLREHADKLKVKPENKTVGQMCRELFYIGSKRMGLSGVYLSQANKGVALATATSTRGADHLRSLPTLATYASWYIGENRSWLDRVKTAFKASKIPWKALKMMSSDRKNLVGNLWDTYTSVFGVPTAIVDKWKESGFLLNRHQNVGWGSMIKYTQECYAVADALSTCKFTTSWRFGVGPIFQADAVESLLGIPYWWKRLLDVGERINAVERALLVLSGNRPGQLDSVSRKFFHEVADRLDERDFNEMLGDFYKECRYGADGSVPANLRNSLFTSVMGVDDYDIAKTIIRTWADTNSKQYQDGTII